MPIADPTGKVTARDVMEFVAGRADAPDESLHIAETEDNAPYGSSATQQDSWGEVQIEPMNAIRSKAAAHLSHCWTDIPHVTHFDKADVTDLEAFRKEYASKAERQGAKLTITAFLLKALAETLKTFPRFNASLDLEKQQMLLKKYYHVGVAVDTPNGLMVPVLRHVNEKKVLEIAREMSEAAEKARDRKLTLEDMRGGTFTVSNLGGLGGYAFTPIINAPEVAILGVSRSQMEPVYQGGAWIPRLMLPLCLSYDHRIIDGADAARFLRFLAEALEKPWRLFLGL
jgi:pyruvate dehydrogenase E2 component (dihydrolipoamide acetyltransferase)